MTRSYKVAVIGLGKIGSLYSSLKVSRSHAEAYMKNPKTNLVAGVDSNKNAQKKFKRKWGKNIKSFSTTREMLSTFQPDIVSICVPTDKLIFILKEISKKPPKFLFLEKPVVNDISIEKKIKKIINTPTAVNYHRCWDPSHSLFFRKIKKSGKILSIHIIYNKGMFNYASHIISLLIFHFGKVSSVKDLKTNNHDTKKLDPSYSFVLCFKYGFQAIFQGFDYISHDLLELEIISSSGIYSIKSGGCRKRLELPRKGAFYKNYNQLVDVPYKDKDGQVDGITQAISNIVNFLDGKEKKIISDIKAALEVSRILFKIKKIKTNYGKKFN